MTNPKIEIFKGRNKQWYFRLKARNSKIIAQSEGYTSKQGAQKGIDSMKDCVLDAVEIYLD